MHPHSVGIIVLIGMALIITTVLLSIQDKQDTCQRGDIVTSVYKGTVTCSSTNPYNQANRGTNEPAP